MFTKYYELVLGILSFQEYKTGAQIYTEIEDGWEAQGIRGFFGGKKIPSLAGIYAALERLEQQGLAERLITQEAGDAAPRMRWRKKEGGQRVKRKQLFSFGFHEPAIA